MKEYKTLYQRLKDEYRVKLIENKEKWPYLAQTAEEALNENKFVVDLTIGQLGDIALVADSTISQSLNSIWKAGLGVSVPTGSIDEGR